MGQRSVRAFDRIAAARGRLGGIALLVLFTLAPMGAAIDGILRWASASLHEAARVRVRFGPPARPAPAAITEDMLLDKRGRPLRGWARTQRIAKVQRERAARAAAMAAAAHPLRVIELPPFPQWIAAGRGRLRALTPTIALPTLPLRWIRVVGVTTVMTFVFATALGTTGFITQQGRVALGASTTISIISGQVSARSADTDDFRPVADGALLRAGMTIRSGANTYAVLTYFEGSTVSIEPETTLVIEALGANPDGSTLIAMRQQIGRTWHSVSRLLNQASRYELRTPSATATVRGTSFAVAVTVDTQGEVVTVVETTEGTVATAKAPTAADPQPQEVLVQPGFRATVRPAAPIEQPTPAPEPERKVTVTVDAPAGLVLDPLGRANGIKNGKVVVQTPGATVAVVLGNLVVTLPDVPDGKIATVIERTGGQRAPVEVITTVSERGRADQTFQTQVDATAPAGSLTAGAAVAAVEVKKGERVEIANVSEGEKKDIASSVKVAEAPSAVVVEERKDEAKRKDEKRDGGGPGGGGGSGFVPPVALPVLPVPGAEGGTIVVRREEPKQEAPKQEGPGFVPRLEAPPAKQGTPKPEPTKRSEPATTAAPRSEPPKPTSEPAPTAEAGGFVPAATLPPLPGPGSGGDKGKGPPPKETPAPTSQPTLEVPKFEVKLPFPQPTPAPRAPGSGGAEKTDKPPSRGSGR